MSAPSGPSDPARALAHLARPVPLFPSRVGWRVPRKSAAQGPRAIRRVRPAVHVGSVTTTERVDVARERARVSPSLGEPLRTRRRRPTGSLSHRPTAEMDEISLPLRSFVRQPPRRERPANVHLTAPRPSPPPDFNQQCSYQPDQPHLSDQARECQRQVFRRLLPRQEALLRVQGEDQEEGHRVPHQLGQGDARSRVERRGEGQVQEEPPPLLHGRQDSLHALPLQHLSWLGTGLWECRVCWNRTGEYRRET